MSSTASSEEEILMCPTFDVCRASAESLLAQNMTRICKSESLFNLQHCHPVLAFSELKLREIPLRNFREGWEIIDEKRRVMPTRSLLKDELEILKINMSKHEMVMDLPESLLEYIGGRDESRRRSSRLRKSLFLQNFRSSRVKDLLSEIDDSESAKTDKVAWKFLKRGSSARKEAINAKKLVLHSQALYLPVLELLSDSHFIEAQPIKITCPNCRFYITTYVEKISTMQTKFTSILLALIRVCIVPQMFYGFNHSVHLCPLCKIYLGFCPAFNIQIWKRKLHKSDSPRESL